MDDRMFAFGLMRYTGFTLEFRRNHCCPGVALSPACRAYCRVCETIAYIHFSWVASNTKGFASAVAQHFAPGCIGTCQDGDYYYCGYNGFNCLSINTDEGKAE